MAFDNRKDTFNIKKKVCEYPINDGQQLSAHFATFTSDFLIKTKLKIVGNL